MAARVDRRGQGRHLMERRRAAISRRQVHDRNILNGHARLSGRIAGFPKGISDCQGKRQDGRYTWRGEGRNTQGIVTQNHRWPAGLCPVIRQRQVPARITAGAAIQGDGHIDVDSLIWAGLCNGQDGRDRYGRRRKDRAEVTTQPSLRPR